MDYYHFSPRGQYIRTKFMSCVSPWHKTQQSGNTRPAGPSSDSFVNTAGLYDPMWSELVLQHSFKHCGVLCLYPFTLPSSCNFFSLFLNRGKEVQLPWFKLLRVPRLKIFLCIMLKKEDWLSIFCKSWHVFYLNYLNTALETELHKVKVYVLIQEESTVLI